MGDLGGRDEDGELERVGEGGVDPNTNPIIVAFSQTRGDA